MPYSTSDAITVTSSSVFGGFRFGSVWRTDITTDLSGEGNNLPESYRLSQNYPNPFNSSTTIKYSLPQNTDVNIAIYDVRGQKIRTLIEGHLNAGHHSIKWNGIDYKGNSVSSGIYLYQIITPGFRETRSMVLLR